VPELLTVEQALAHVLAHAKPLPTETVPLDDAFGRVLREPARSIVEVALLPVLSAAAPRSLENEA